MEKFKNFIHKWIWILLLVFCVVGVIYPVVGIGAIICMLAPSVLAFWKGRKWCGNYCPRGSFNDIILTRISRKKPIPKVLKAKWFRNTFFIVLMSGFIVQIYFAWGNLSNVGMVFVRMIIITTLITIILGITYKPRTWCAFCPMGTMASWVTKLVGQNKIKNVTFSEKACVDCNQCTKVCPIGINVLSYKQNGKVINSDCIKCNKCVMKCPKKSLGAV